MGDRRFVGPYLRVKNAPHRADVIHALSDEEVIAAVAAAAADGDALLANILATEAQNRLGLYGAILATMGEGVFAVGSLGDVTAMNPAAESLLGWRFEDLERRRIDDVLDCRIPTREGVFEQRALVADALAAATPRREDHALLTRKDGRSFAAAYVASPILRDGEVRGAVVVFRDITARRRAEEDARRLAAIVTASDDAIVSFALDGTILSWNPRAEQVFGARAKDAIGKHGKLVLPTQFHADLDALLQRPRNGGGPLQHMTRRVERDGQPAFLSMTATHVLDRDGALVALAWVTEDVTQATLREETIRRSEERYRLLLDSATEHAIFELDPRGHVTTWNPAAERIKKWKADEIIGWHYSVLFPPEEVKNGDPWMELQAAKRDGQYTAEVRRMRKTGEIFDASVTLSAMRDPAGELVGFVKVTRDVTERKAWERKLETRDEHYRTLFEMLGEPAVWCDPMGHIATANAAFCEGVGIPPKDLTGRAFVSLSHPKDRETAQAVLAVVKEGAPTRRAFAVLGPTGKKIERTWSLRPILREGVCTGFFVVGETGTVNAR